jgi:hypothetical protein
MRRWVEFFAILQPVNDFHRLGEYPGAFFCRQGGQQRRQRQGLLGRAADLHGCRQRIPYGAIVQRGG